MLSTRKERPAYTITTFGTSCSSSRQRAYLIATLTGYQPTLLRVLAFPRRCAHIARATAWRV